MHTPLQPQSLPKYIISLPGGSDSRESACNTGDLDSVSGLGRSPGERNGNPPQYFACRIPWTEEPGRLQPMGSQRVEHSWITNTFTFIYCSLMSLLGPTLILEATTVMIFFCHTCHTNAIIQYTLTLWYLTSLTWLKPLAIYLLFIKNEQN